MHRRLDEEAPASRSGRHNHRWVGRDEGLAAQRGAGRGPGTALLLLPCRSVAAQMPSRQALCAAASLPPVTTLASGLHHSRPPAGDVVTHTRNRHAAAPPRAGATARRRLHLVTAGAGHRRLHGSGRCVMRHNGASDSFFLSTHAPNHSLEWGARQEGRKVRLKALQQQCLLLAWLPHYYTPAGGQTGRVARKEWTSQSRGPALPGPGWSPFPWSPSNSTCNACACGLPPLSEPWPLLLPANRVAADDALASCLGLPGPPSPPAHAADPPPCPTYDGFRFFPGLASFSTAPDEDGVTDTSALGFGGDLPTSYDLCRNDDSCEVRGGAGADEVAGVSNNIVTV